MNRFRWGGVLLLGLAAGCDASHLPRLALPKEGTATSTSAKVTVESGPATSPAAKAVAKAAAKAQPTMKYHGRTPEQWSKLLQDGDINHAYKACSALRLMGPEGRKYLVEALDSPNPESRRLALESLTVSDLRAYGDQGRQLLIHLAGDRQDMRIRERATYYLSQWSRATPAR